MVSKLTPKPVEKGLAKFGFLQNEKELVTALAKKSKKSKTEDDNAGMAYVRPFPSSKKLTTNSYREIDRFAFVRNSDCIPRSAP
jgi:hypothetical protein